MNKRIDPTGEFPALPSVHILRNAGMKEGQTQSYNRALWLIRQAQERAAVIAAEVLRPNDIAEARYARREAVRDANEKYREHCLEVFAKVTNTIL